MTRGIPAIRAGIVAGCILSAAGAAADPAKPAGGWQLEVSPYFWLAGLSGDVGVPSRLGGDRTVNVSIDQKFTDIFQNLGGIPFMGTIEARHGNFTFLGDFLYLQLESGAETPGPAFGGADFRLTNTIGSGVVTYRAVEDRRYSLEFGGGIRVWSLSTRLSLAPGVLPGGAAKNSTTWVDPLVAGRARIRLADRLSLSLYADIGGLGVGSDMAWQAMGTIDYAAADWLDLKIGYRYLSVDYQADNARFDLRYHGPILAAAFKF